ncbi:hypothetical protein [Actinocorallia libanotica]|uniref:Transposase n=1 Tax=Actinocorallia libanotica TaxID=46162 RepID=A0ABP4BQN1_9ACTN
MEMARCAGGRQGRRREAPGLFRGYEERSGGGLVFTSAAQRSWIRCRYQNEELMYQTLDRLSEAAAQWRGSSGDVRERLHDWLIRTVGLRYSPIDKALKKNGLDRFWFAGRQFSRVHHIKLEDHVPPTRVGRIYFALDTRDHRWIVDHVGLKLYRV